MDVKFTRNNILTKTALFLLVILIVLPCTVKQEFKKALDVPIQQERFEKPDKNVVCQNITIDETRKTAEIAIDGEHDPADFETKEHVFPFFPKDDIQLIGQAPTPAPAPVPLFILHERYLI